MPLKKAVRGTFFAAIAALAIGTRTAAFADTAVTFNKWVDEVKVSGDYRVRYEYFGRPTRTEVDRKRFRFRLRLNTDFSLPSKLTAKMTFASGTGEQVSTNQSFDNLSAQKSLWIDKAYVVWQPLSALKLQGGRMENPIWRQYSSDVVWDSDFNPEAFSQSVDGLVGPIRLFANAMQMVADEDSGANGPNGQQKDQWLWAEQVGLETRLPLQSRLKLAAAKYQWSNIGRGTLGQAATNAGNRRVAGVLVNDFDVMEYTGELSTWVFNLPLSMQGTGVKNIASRAGIAGGLQDKAYQAGAILGKAKEKNSWEIAYFNKWAQTDATVADVSDSDFGDGGTNRKGHIYWIAYAPTEFTTVSLKYLQSDVISRSLSPSVSNSLGERIDRYQADFVVKF